MKTKKNYKKKKNTNNNQNLKNKSRRKNINKKKNKKKSRKKNNSLQRGGSVNEKNSLIGKVVTIINHPKYNNHKAKLIKYIPGDKNTYMSQLIDTNYNKIFDEIPYLTEDQFTIDQDFSSIQSKSASDRKIYVLWVVNCDSCKVSTIPYCSSNGIYDTYHYYKSINEVYIKLKNYLKVEKLMMSFYSSILLRAQETAKIITKGIMDSLPDLYTNINPKGITIMNYCQEIQKFKTSYSKVLEHVELLNRLIPGTLSINSDNIMGIQKDSSRETQVSSVSQEQPEESLITQSSQESNQGETPSVVESENPPIAIETLTKDSLDENTQIPLEEKKKNSHTMIDNEEDFEVDSGNTLVEQPETAPPTDNSKGSSFFDFFKRFRKPSDEDINQNSEKDTNQEIITDDNQIQVQNGGGFMNFITSLFSNSAKEQAQEQTQEQTQELSQEKPQDQPLVNVPVSEKISKPITKISENKIPMIDFITQKDDYENWKEQVLPFLDENQLNVVISHGYYIKKNVLNNVSNSRAGNLDAFLLEYTYVNNKLSHVNLLDNDLTKKTEISSSPVNNVIIPTIGSHLNKTQDLWNNTITIGSSLEDKDKYSRCLFR